MGFWSIFKKNDETFKFSDDPQSSFLKGTLIQATSRPLNDHTTRLVLASPHRTFILDVGLLLISSLLESREQSGIQRARIQATKVVERAVSGSGVSEEALASAVLAFFDFEFTVGANKGKDSETGWNTLSLDVEIRNGVFRATRSACRLELPNDWPLDLNGSPMDMLDGLFKAKRR